MNPQQTADCDQDIVVTALAAELTNAAYPVALKYGISGSSIDLELEIWKTLTDVVCKWRSELASMNRFPAPQP